VFKIEDNILLKIFWDILGYIGLSKDKPYQILNYRAGLFYVLKFLKPFWSLNKWVSSLLKDNRLDNVRSGADDKFSY
jgi:hypothetical protein